MRPHGKIKLDTARKPSFVVMAVEYDWINIWQSLNPVHSVPGGDVTRGRQGGFSCGSAGHILFLEASVVLRRPPRVLHRMEKDIYLSRTRPGGSDSHPQSVFIKNRPNYPACRSYFGPQRAGDFDY